MYKIRSRDTLPTDREVDVDLAQLFGVTSDPISVCAGGVYGYTRRSKLEKYAPEESLSGQAQRITDYAREQQLGVPTIYQDPGFSGRNSQRPGLRALKRAVKANRVRVLIIDRLDRLSRNLFVLLDLVKLFSEHNVRLISVRENIDFSQHFGLLILYVLGALSEFYSRLLSEEMRLVRKHQAEQGRLSGSTPFGYCNGRCSTCHHLNGPGYCPYAGNADRHNGAFRIPHPVESVAVRLAFEWYATGKYSDDNIARRLNAETCVLDDGTELPFQTAGRAGVWVRDPDADATNIIWTGNDAEDKVETQALELRYPPGAFNRDTVHAILTNPVYAGFVAYYSTYESGEKKGKPLKGKKRRKPVSAYRGQHEPLVPLGLYRHVQTIRRNKYHCTAGENNPTQAYPLTGLLFCSAAHRPLRGVSSNGGRQRYYVDKLCQQSLPREQWHQKNLCAPEIEEQVADLVGRLQLPAAWRERILAYVVYTEGTDEIEREKFMLRERLKRAQELYELGDYTRSRLERVYAECRAQLANLAPEAGPVGHEAATLLDNWPALWASFTPDEMKTLLYHIFSAIYVNDEGIAAIELRKAFVGLLGGS